MQKYFVEIHRDIKSYDEITDGLEIRETVFVKEQGFGESNEKDEDDFTSAHFIAYYQNGGIRKAFGNVRLINKENYGKLSRMAILKEFRGKGLSKYLMEALIKEAKEQKYKRIYVEAQHQVEKFFTIFIISRQFLH